MGAKKRVPLHQNPRGFVEVDPSATEGAILGVNLRDSAGRVIRPEDVINQPTSGGGGTSSIASTIWKLIREIPANIQKLAALIGRGFAIRRDDGEWALRTLQPGDGIDIANGDGEAGDPTISLEDLPNSGVGAALVKITRDGKGRVEGTQPASTTDLVEGANLYYTNARADARITAQKGQPNGLAPLDANSLIPTSYLPPLALTDVFVVNSQAAQLALVAQEGDVAIRTDISKNYIHNGGTAGTMADWAELLTPAAPVQSVNGKTGTVSLTPADVGAATAAQGTKADSAVQSVVQGARISVNNADPRNPIVSADADKSGVFIGGVELTSNFSVTGGSVIVAIPGMTFSFVMPDRPVMISFGSTAFYDSTSSSNLGAIILRVNGSDVAQLFFSAAITNYWSQGKQYLLSGIAPGTTVNLAWYLNKGAGTFTVFGAPADKPYIYVVTA